MVDELRSVVRVEHEKREREHALQGGDGLDDPFRGVVADRRVLGPPGDQVGHRQSPRELALERWPAVRDGVRLDHPRRRGRFVADLAQPDRVTQHRRRSIGIWHLPASRCSCGASVPPTVSYTHLRAHETKANLVCRLLLEKKQKTTPKSSWARFCYTNIPEDSRKN